MTRSEMNDYDLARVFKGLSHHRRVRILTELKAREEMNLSEIARLITTSAPHAGSHVRFLEEAGLLSKRRKGRAVIHRVSSRGTRLLKLMSILS